MAQIDGPARRAKRLLSAEQKAEGGATFYRIEAATHTYDEESFAAALVSLDEALDIACTEGGFDRADSVVGGFSQGAGLALAPAYGFRRATRATDATTARRSGGFQPADPSAGQDGVGPSRCRPGGGCVRGPRP